ncbi:MAG: glycosyl hydrolase family 76 [Tannerellaceae bacterium]|jgi:predicted alpha-1,6-mannanase (GH76 family)|nr:glycosyl hydrolase family 76 [Tannerellaceae bacterium]
MNAMQKITLLIVLPFLFATCGEGNNGAINPDEPYTVRWGEAADSSSTVLITSFWNVGEKYFNYDSNGKNEFHYWPQAHALDVLVDAYLRTGDEFYKTYFDPWYEGVRIKNGNTFQNDYYDDMEWIALAMLRTWQATGDEKFKNATLDIWEYIKTGWNDSAGGGIAWVKSQPYSKNACSNGPACILAARLYQQFGDEANKEWALKIYDWEKATLFNANNGMVLDNINGNTGEKTNWVFTYNQGTFVGSAVELHKITGEKAYLNDAVLAANYTLNSLVNAADALLKDEGSGDGGLFKGIFIRYFAELIGQERLDASDKKRYLQFLEHNANVLWQQGTNKSSVLFAPYWKNRPASQTGLTEQLSGCMLIEAAAQLIPIAQ